MSDTKKLVALYLALIVLTSAYLFGIENITNGTYSIDKGGRDHQFTFYDITLFLISMFAAALTGISSMAYSKKKSPRLFFVSFAFFLFTIKAALKIIDNFLIGNYSYIGISIQTLEFLILLSLFYALFKK
jgi:hypothetical protein